MIRNLLSVAANLFRVAFVMATIYLTLVVAAHFPRTVGPMVVDPIKEEAVARDYYETAYRPNEGDGSDSSYVLTSWDAAHRSGIQEELRSFIQTHDLADKRHLEIGAGSGSLQDAVEDYTGLDIAASAARYFHKPFVQGSATDLPFDDNEFDAIWTVWTLEHVPDPEKALEEMRRVVKPGGMLFVFPAWNATSWAPRGYQVRPYSDFDWAGKLVKASVAIRSTNTFRTSWLIPTRLIRYGWWRATNAETRLRYQAIQPNYTTYWQPDSDATAGIDSHEAMLWYISRGDECASCPKSAIGAALMPYEPLIIRVRKPATSVAADRGPSRQQSGDASESDAIAPTPQ